MISCLNNSYRKSSWIFFAAYLTDCETFSFMIVSCFCQTLAIPLIRFWFATSFVATHLNFSNDKNRNSGNLISGKLFKIKRKIKCNRILSQHNFTKSVKQRLLEKTAQACVYFISFISRFWSNSKIWENSLEDCILYTN